jgi:hypothetical protein
MLTRIWHPFEWVAFCVLFAGVVWLGNYAGDHQWYVDWRVGLQQHLGWHLVLIWCEGMVILMSGFALFRAFVFAVRVAMEQEATDE